MIQVAVYARNMMSGGTIRDLVKQTLNDTGLSENTSYRPVVLTTEEGLAETLRNAETAGDSVLLVAELNTRQGARQGRNAIFPTIQAYLKRHPESADGVILVTGGGYFLDTPRIIQLPITNRQVIRKLNDEGIQQLTGLVRNFVKVDTDRGLTDYDHYAKEIQKYKNTWRTPLTSASSAHNTAHQTVHPLAPARDDSDPSNAKTQAEQRSASPEQVRQKWAALAEDIKDIATARLDTAKAEAAKATPLTGDDPRVATIHALLHLWVEARLYALRAYSNYLVYYEANAALRDKPNVARDTLGRIPPGFGINQKRFSVFKQVDGIVKEYGKTLRTFDTSVRKVSKKRRLFRDRLGDAEQFRTWSKEFGPDMVKPDTEPGWDVQAASAQRELHYHYRDALRHEFWLSGYRVSASIMRIFKFIAGYGTQPRRTAVITGAALLLFGVAHALDDAITGCHIHPPHSIPFLSGLQYYLEVSVSSLTSLGSPVPACGSFNGLLLALETLFGYFLLAVLTTLFVQALSEH